MSISSMTSAHTVSRLVRTEATGEQLGKQVTYSTEGMGAALTCTVCPLQGSEAYRWWQRGVLQPHAIYFASDPSLDERDKLRWNEKGTIMQVMAPAQDAHGQGRLFKVIANAESIDNPRPLVIA